MLPVSPLRLSVPSSSLFSGTTFLQTSAFFRKEKKWTPSDPNPSPLIWDLSCYPFHHFVPLFHCRLFLGNNLPRKHSFAISVLSKYSDDKREYFLKWIRNFLQEMSRKTQDSAKLVASCRGKSHFRIFVAPERASLRNISRDVPRRTKPDESLKIAPTMISQEKGLCPFLSEKVSLRMRLF